MDGLVATQGRGGTSKREPRPPVGDTHGQGVGGQQHPGAGVEDGLVGEVDDLVGGEPVDAGQQRRQRRLAVTMSATPYSAGTVAPAEIFSVPPSSAAPTTVRPPARSSSTAALTTGG